MRKINFLIIVSLLVSMAAFASTAFAGSVGPGSSDATDKGAEQYTMRATSGYTPLIGANGAVLFYLAPVKSSFKGNASYYDGQKFADSRGTAVQGVKGMGIAQRMTDIDRHPGSTGIQP